MKLVYLLTAALISLSIITSCDEVRHPRNSNYGPVVTGKVGEILVVCENGIWDSKIKNNLDSGLTQYILPYLPDVATFSLIHKTPQHFTQGVKRYRNTLFITIDPNYTGEKASITSRKDVWAIDQLVVEVVGKDFNQVFDGTRDGMHAVHELFNEIEWKRLMKKFDKERNKKTREKIKENFGIDVVLPSNSSIVTSRPNFFRIEFPPASRPIEFVGTGTQDAGSIFSGICIYQYTYKDSSQFDLDQLLMARDTMLKYNVPSEIEGMYMGTQYNEFVYPEGNTMQTADGQLSGYEMRGMYVFEGNGKFGTGGAFWAYHFRNKNTNKLVCVSGYVDAPPTTSWTHPLREIQAILKSVKIVE